MGATLCKWWCTRHEMNFSFSSSSPRSFFVILVQCVPTSLLSSSEATLFENYPKCRIWIFEFWHFPPIFVLLKLTCLVTMFDTKLQVSKNSPKWSIFGIFMLNEIILSKTCWDTLYFHCICLLLRKYMRAERERRKPPQMTKHQKFYPSLKSDMRKIFLQKAAAACGAVPYQMWNMN